MSGVNGPDRPSSTGKVGGKVEIKRNGLALPRFQPVKFGGFHNPTANSSTHGIETRLSAAGLQQFQNLIETYKSVEFQEYPEERIPQLVIGEDFMEDSWPKEQCEV